MERTDAGFTLVELLVVSVLGVFILGAIYQTLTVQQRTYEHQRVVIETNEASRTTMELLAAELREISSSGSDLVEAASDEVTIRVMRKVGFACFVPGSSMLDVWALGQSFEEGDQALVFDQGGDPDDASDDAWLAVEVDGTSAGYNSSGCGDWSETTLRGADLGSYPRQRLVLSGPALTTVVRGAPVRSFETMTYGIYDFDGEWMLGRSADGGAPVALVGPLAPPGGRGLVLRYYDADGNEISPADLASNLNQVASFNVAVRALATAPNLVGSGDVDDRLSVTIFLRNNDLFAF